MADLLPASYATGPPNVPVFTPNGNIIVPKPIIVVHHSPVPIIIIIVITFLIIIGYTIFIIIMAKGKKWIFSTYKPPPLTNGLQPGGDVVERSPDVTALQQSTICNAYAIYGLTPPASCATHTTATT
jgi:hypothetical protein